MRISAGVYVTPAKVVDGLLARLAERVREGEAKLRNIDRQVKRLA